MDVLDRLCPLHLRIDARGELAHIGPALARMAPGALRVGAAALPQMRVLFPHGLAHADELWACADLRLRMVLRALPGLTFRAQAAADLQLGGGVLNLSLPQIPGDIGLPLRMQDLAATDLTPDHIALGAAADWFVRASAHVQRSLENARSAAEHRAFTDPLTGLANRRAVERALPRLCALGHPFAVLHLDLDRFKQINDTHGHATGDAVLREVAHRLRQQLRGDDIIARIGGDEFVILLHGRWTVAALQACGARIITSLRRPIRLDGAHHAISASLGAAVWPLDAQAGPEAILKAADTALYRAKAEGRDRLALHLGGAENSASPQADFCDRGLEPYRTSE